MIIKNKRKHGINKERRIGLLANKKAQAPVWGWTVGLVIAGVVLILTGILLYQFFSGKAIPFFSYLPGFNQTQPRASQSGVFSYDPTGGEVYYYTGTDWQLFRDKTDIGGKIIDSGVLYNNFRQFAFQKSAGYGEVKLGGNRIVDIIGVSRKTEDFGYFIFHALSQASTFDSATLYYNPAKKDYPYWYFDIWYGASDYAAKDYGRISFTNDVLIKKIKYFDDAKPTPDIYTKLKTFTTWAPDFSDWSNDDKFTSDSGDVFGVVRDANELHIMEYLAILKLDDNFYIEGRTDNKIGDITNKPVKATSLTSEQSAVYNGMKKWRDGILNSPYLFEYTDSKGVHHTASYCVKKSAGKYAYSVDFTKPVAEGTKTC